jgi:thiol-disulfide isomerase/thioredoxin
MHHTFIIKNEGTAPLEIKKVKPSCGCTIAGAYPRKIAPGESGEFPFSVASKRLRNKFEKSITITSNDPSTPSFRLRIRGEIKHYVNVVPPNVYFGKVYGEAVTERVLKITNNTENPLELKIHKGLTDNFSVKLVATNPGKVYELRISAKPPFEPGVFRKTILLSTNIEAQKNISIDVRGSIPKRLDVNPALLNVGVRRLGARKDRPITRIVRFTNYGSIPVRLLEAAVDDPAITAKINELTEGKAYSIQVDIPSGYDMPAQGRKLTLKTDDRKQPQIVVPIRDLSKQRTARAKRRRPAEEMVGRAVPDFSITTTDGKTLAGADLKGKVTVLNFFAPNCGFCTKQFPRVEKIRQKYAEKGVRFVAVSQTMRNKKFTDEQVVDKIKGLGFHGELAINHNNNIGRRFKATSYPTMVVIGKTGKIGAVNIGNLGDLEKRLPAQLDALLAGKAVPKFDKVATAKKVEKPKKPRPKRKRPDDLVGKTAPAFSFETLDGKKVSNADLAKHPAIVLNVVAPNCGYCKKQIPRLEKIRKEYTEKGVRFINVVQTMRKKFEKDQVVDAMKQLGSRLELAHDPDNKVGPLFNATGFPTMIVLGKSGKVEAVHVGNIGDLEKRLKGELDALIAGKAVPKFASASSRRRRPAEDLVGKPAPTFKITTLDGKTVSNDSFKEHPATVLNFIAPNCGYCKKQLPNVEKVRKEYESKGVRFVTVAQKMRKDYTDDEIVDVMKKAGANLELSTSDFATKKVGGQFKAVSFPTMFVVNREGKIAYVNIGAKQNLESLLKGQLDGLIKGKPVGMAPAAGSETKAVAAVRP